MPKVAFKSRSPFSLPAAMHVKCFSRCDLGLRLTTTRRSWSPRRLPEAPAPCWMSSWGRGGCPGSTRVGSLKSQVCTAGGPTTGGTQILAGRVPTVCRAEPHRRPLRSSDGSLKALELLYVFPYGSPYWKFQHDPCLRRIWSTDRVFAGNFFPGYYDCIST